LRWYFPELLKQFRIIRWDLPEHGLSAALDSNSSPLTVNALLDPLIEKCDELGIRQFHYVDTSIGGMALGLESMAATLVLR
jgi:3-oxoadipate enol-lactonase